MHTIFFLSLIIIAIGTYAIRALYFAVLQEGHSSCHNWYRSGCYIIDGYTPDIFVGLVMGYLLDDSPEKTDH